MSQGWGHAWGDRRRKVPMLAILSSDFKIMDRISRKYTGKDFPMRDNPAQRVVLVIEVERVRFVRLPFTHTPA